ncbi:hypothetical protein [Teredinibacter turnerae]|uniref:hypothetical protein n=1 Tax=Teredinibacter turnerae TaxID=2426 RepID=UPI0030D58972
MHNLATKENAFTSASTQSDSSYDALSPWFEIRSVAMAGFDYVFAPMAMCNQINELISLQEFLINAQAMLGSEPQRTILVGFEYDAQDNLLLDRYDVEWLNDMIVDCRRTTVNGCSQFEFMETLFEHSENLVVI